MGLEQGNQVVLFTLSLCQSAVAWFHHHCGILKYERIGGKINKPCKGTCRYIFTIICNLTSCLLTKNRQKQKTIVVMIIVSPNPPPDSLDNYSRRGTSSGK